MNLDFTVSTSFFFYGMIGIFFFLAGFIYLGKRYFKRLSEAHLAGEVTKRKYASPIIGRNKYPDVNVFRASTTYLKMGLLVALLMTVLAMNVTTFEEKIDIPENALVLTEEFEIEPPRTSEPPPPPPPPPPPVIEEVPNEEFIEEDEVAFLDQSIDENTEVAYVPPPVVEKKETAPPPPPPDEVEIEEIFKVVEEMPRFPGCDNLGDKIATKKCADQKMLTFIYKHISYPPIARENGVDGTVVIQFVVNTKGEIKNARIVRDIGAQCGAEALRVVNLMNEKAGLWTPGKQRGKNVKVQFNLPVKFKLESV